MTKILLICGLLLLLPGVALAQSDTVKSAPPAMTWRYDCVAGTQCPSNCSLAGKELFSTSDYHSITIAELSGPVYWIKIDTGQRIIEYIGQSEQFHCMISGALLVSAGYQDPAKLATAKEK